MSPPIDARRLAWVAVTITAVAATHLGHLPSWLPPAIALAVVARVVAHRRGQRPPSTWIRIPLTFALLAAIIATYGNVFGREPGSALACGLLALKFLETERVRDARVAIAFACFVLMSSLLFASNLGFSLVVGSVLLVAIAALASLQPDDSLGMATPREPKASLATGAGLLLAGIPLAAVAFIALPRLESPLWGARGADGAGRTGLSDTMAPGQFSRLMLDETPAFRAAFHGSVPRPSQQYFRAIVMSDFDGTTWTRRDDSRSATELPAVPAGQSIDYSITLETTNQRWMPALDLPFTQPDDARMDRDQVLVARLPNAQPRKYELRSSPLAQLSTVLSARDRARMLRLPDGFGGRARALAADWRSRFVEDPRIVEAALQLFHSSFTYTLEPPPLARDSIDDFLFGTQRGFCEHYASAFVFLMRAAGIPARVVTGYQGGWWSGDYLLVRQSDAHAWAEVWRDGSGWERVDPTAAVSPSRIEVGAAAANATTGWFGDAWRGFRNQLDFVSRVWTESIVRFDSLRQRSLLTQFGIAEVGRRDLLLGFAALLAVAMALAATWAMRDARTTRGDDLDRAWARLRARLARAGLAPRTHEGPFDLLTRARGIDEELAARITPLVDEYVTLRYATHAPAPERVRAFVALVGRLSLRRVRATMRHSATSS